MTTEYPQIGEVKPFHLTGSNADDYGQAVGSYNLKARDYPIGTTLVMYMTDIGAISEYSEEAVKRLSGSVQTITHNYNISDKMNNNSHRSSYSGSFLIESIEVMEPSDECVPVNAREYFVVPRNEKNDFKLLGGRWEPKHKLWWIAGNRPTSLEQADHRWERHTGPMARYDVRPSPGWGKNYRKKW